MTGAWNLSSSVISPMIGVYLNDKFVGVTTENLKGYSTLCLISLCVSFLTFFLLPLIPTANQIIQFKDEREPGSQFCECGTPIRKRTESSDKSYENNTKDDSEFPLIS